MFQARVVRDEEVRCGWAWESIRAHPARALAKPLWESGPGPVRADPTRLFSAPVPPHGARPRTPARGPGPERQDNAARGEGRAARRPGVRAAFLPAGSASRRRRRRRRARGLAARPSAPPRPAPGRPPPPAGTRPSPPESLGARCWVAGSSRRLCAYASGLAREARRQRSPRRGGRTGRARAARGCARRPCSCRPAPRPRDPRPAEAPAAPAARRPAPRRFPLSAGWAGCGRGEGGDIRVAGRSPRSG